MLRSLIVSYKGTAAAWLQVFDTADSGSLPSAFEEFELVGTNSIADLRFRNGVYVRAVTAAGGSTPISADDCKFRADYETGPLS